MDKSEFNTYFALREEGAFQEAYDVLRRILTSSSRWSRVGDLYVWCAEFELMLHDDYGNASEFLKEAARLGCEEMEEYHRVHGFVLWGLGECIEGKQELRRAVELNPSVTCLQTLGSVLTAERDPQAMFVWRHVLDKDPRNCRAHIGMARLLADGGDKDKALLTMRRAEELDPSPHALAGIASAYAELGEPRRAVNAYLEADRRGLQPKAPLYASIAACYLSLGDKETGVRYLRWAQQHDSEHQYVKGISEWYCKNYEEITTE